MNIEQTFHKLKNKFDIEEPNIGHFNRFEARLKSKNKSKKFSYKYIAVAATISMLFGISFALIQPNKGVELAEISPKMGETQDYFTAVIQEELEKINKVKNIGNEQIINDAFLQLKQLEKNYKKLTFELKESNNNSKEIIFAMINNYQQRITVLQNLLNNLVNFKQLKNRKNENNIS
ncbi:MAG: hypothetical protein L3J23_00975 [Flavobacteriaceae bacterium]|nr:hypothetical protein [Flavobacteriaceae bacterium]